MARKEDLPVSWTVKRRDIVAAARSFIGVPYRHQGRSVRGVDCSGLVLLVAAKLNIPMKDSPTAYSNQPTGAQLVAPCEEQCWRPDDQGSLVPGDLVVFWGPTPREPQHFAFIGDGVNGPTMIHSASKFDKVLEHGWNKFWREHYYARYWLAGTEET